MEIINRKYKENSHQPTEKIKEMQAKHRDDLVQPREGGEINPRYVELYGSKNINPTSHDVEYLAKKSHRLADVLDNKRRQQFGSRKYY